MTDSELERFIKMASHVNKNKPELWGDYFQVILEAATELYNNNPENFINENLYQNVLSSYHEILKIEKDAEHARLKAILKDSMK